MISRKNAILCIAYLSISYCLFFIAINKFQFLHFSVDLLIMFNIINAFVSAHFIFDIKKMYDLIFKKRYIIGFIIFTFLVIGKYNGSSIEIWNRIIQPSYQLNNEVIIGKPRDIRSDEWLVSTPITLSQATGQVNYAEYNNLLGATQNLVTLNPKLPNKNIFSLLSSPNNIGYLLLGKERGFSFSWYFCYFLLFFSSLEMFLIITKQKKLLSFLGAILITLSPVIQWWQSPQIVSYGNLAIVIFYYFIKSDNKKKKFLLSILFGYSGLLYIMCLYPAWQIPYGYCYLILMIWIIASNKNKVSWKDLIYIIPAVSVIAIIILPLLISNKEVFEITTNTVYPGQRLSTGGGEWHLLFTYINSIYYPFNDFGNPCEFSQYISIFPIPIIYGIYTMVKNKKFDLFICLSTIILIILCAWICFPIGTIFSRISLLYMTTEARAQVAVGFLSVILLIYIISNYQTEKIDKVDFKKIVMFIVSGVCALIIVKVSNSVTEDIFSGYVNLNTSIISGTILTIVIFLILINYKKTNIFLSIILIIISIISGAIVSPINKGIDVFYTKPVSKEIDDLVSKNKSSIFLASDSGITLSNYIVVNGAKTINTTNYIPNLELYKKLDVDNKYNDIYNRYEHVAVNIVDKKTEFILNQDDYITINLNYSDVCKINVDYLITNNSNDNYNSFNLIYDEYGIKIFRTNC